MDATQITQLVVAITALITAIATLAKVFQHEGILTETKATVQTVQHQTNNQLEALQAKVDTLQAVAKARLEASQATPAEVAARPDPVTSEPPA